jgi:hypothetical protein
MKGLRKELILIIILVLILAIGGIIFYVVKKGGISPKAATVGVTLALSPNSGNEAVGSNFTVNILLNTNSQATVGTDVILTYNPLDLQVQDADAVTPGVQIQAGSLYYSYPVNTVDTTNGKISFSGIIQPGGANYSGSGTLATITFKALRVQSASSVNFMFTQNATNDSNVTSPTGSDLLYSVTNGSYNLVPPDVTFNYSDTLQGRSNYSASGATLKIFTLGTTTVVYTNSNLAMSAAGSGQITISGAPAGTYDFQLKVPNFLSTKLTSVALVSPLTLNFGLQKSGDLNNDNIVNTVDFATLSAKWSQSDPVSDINQDGIVNTVDFALLNANWLIQGQ